jgi:hypothetical protein
MVDPIRKKSPRAPSIGLEEALERALHAYDKERLHPAPADVIAQDIGYKGANSGTALQALASLRYFGLLERPRDGILAVSKDVESYKFAPHEVHRRELLVRFLRSPPLFAELLNKYSTGLPSDANLKHELIIQKGFTPAAADIALRAFKQSVQFARFFDKVDDPVPEDSDNEVARDEIAQPVVAERATNPKGQEPSSVEPAADLDRIPVRLPGNRRAWLLIPVPFYESDKARLKAQIDLLLTEENEGGAS